MRATLLLLIFSLVSAGHAAEYVHKVGEHTYTAREASDCFEISEAAVGECVRLFFEESEKKLATALGRIRGSLTRDRQLFEETQAKWLSFRNSECEIRSVSAQAYRDPERQKGLFVRACAAELNAQRSVQLDSLSLGCDSCLQ